MGYSYAHEHGMGVVACRIGNFSRDRDQPTHPHELGWHDCGEVFCQAISHPLPPVVHPGGRTTHAEKEVFFHQVFAVSDSTWPMYDLEHGKKVIGYYPKKSGKAASFSTNIFVQSDVSQESVFLKGPWCFGFVRRSKQN